MPRWKIAVAPAPFSLSLKESIEAVSQTGADGVQFNARDELKSKEFGETARRELLHRLSERGLGIASLTFPLRRPLYDVEHLDGRVAALKEAMEFAGKIRCRVVTTRIGRLPEENSPDAQRLQDALRDLAQYGNHVGVVLCITPSSDTSAALLKWLGTITEGPLGVDFDPAGALISHLEPATALRELHTLVSHYQARDAVRDLESGGIEAQLGRGEVDWDQQLAILDDMKYSGWLTVRRTNSENPHLDCTRAVAYLRQVGLE